MVDSRPEFLSERSGVDCRINEKTSRKQRVGSSLRHDLVLLMMRD